MPELEHLVHFERLRERLLHAGVAPRHVRRTLAELGEHFDDALWDEQANGLDKSAAKEAAWVRLGGEDEIVQGILAHPVLRSLPARFPRLIFGSGPLLLWIGAIVFTVLGLDALVNLSDSLGIAPKKHAPESQWLYGPAYAACFFYTRILPLLIGFAILAAALRQRLPLTWPLVGVTTIALFGGTTDVDVKFSTHAGEPGELSIGNNLIPLFTQPFTDAIGVFQPGVFMNCVAIGLPNLVLILTPFLIWRKYYKRQSA